MGNLTTTASEVEILMQTIADGWNEGNAGEAADCFNQDAVYVEQPHQQVYRGREELYEFFGGDDDPEIPMHMTRQHLAFNEEEQVDFRGYSSQLHGKYHGIVTMKLQDGLIKFWREYQYESELNWKEFTQHNPF